MNRRKKISAIGTVTDKAALKIAGIVTGVQRSFSGAMNRLTRNWSAKSWKLIIFLSAVAWGYISVRCVVRAFSGKVIIVTTKPHFIIKPAAGDSLALMERIYEQRKK